MTDTCDPQNEPRVEGFPLPADSTMTTTTTVDSEEENMTETLFEQDQKETRPNPQALSVGSTVCVRCRKCNALVCDCGQLQATLPAGNEVRFVDVLIPKESQTKESVTMRPGIEYGVECTEVLCAACGGLLGVETCPNRWTLNLLNTCLSEGSLPARQSNTTTTTTTTATDDPIGRALEQVTLSFDVGGLDEEDEPEKEDEEEQEQKEKEKEEEEPQPKETVKDAGSTGTGWGWMALGSAAALALPGVLAVLLHKK